MSPLVYISGPITATATRSVEQHVAHAADAYFTLARAGIPAICVHLACAYPSAWASGLTYEDWMALDLQLIEHCTHLLLLPGWRESRGTMRELDHWHACGHGHDVYERIDLLIQDVRGTP